MPSRDPELRRKHYRDWYYRHAGRQQQYNQARKEKVRRWFIDYKKTLRCNVCGETHPACLEFHHREREEKESVISTMVNNACRVAKIKEEIEKCDVLCANCHRKLHWPEGIWPAESPRIVPSAADEIERTAVTSYD